MKYGGQFESEQSASWPLLVLGIGVVAGLFMLLVLAFGHPRDAALIPLALGGGKAGSEIQTPMAIVILCGLITSTLLNMIVVPTLYLRYGRQTSGA